jgi:hypothetical protein
LWIVLTKTSTNSSSRESSTFDSFLQSTTLRLRPARVEFGAAWLARWPWPLPSVPICDGGAVGETRAEAVDALKPYPHGPLAIRRARRHHTAPAPPCDERRDWPATLTACPSEEENAQSVSMPAARSPNEIKPATRCDTLPRRLPVYGVPWSV